MLVKNYRLVDRDETCETYFQVKMYDSRVVKLKKERQAPIKQFGLVCKHETFC